jgi:hypothetical protein
MTLDGRIRREILQDLKTVTKNIANIYASPEKNKKIKEPNYKSPLFLASSVPLRNVDGSLAYFKDLRDTLESALEYGSIPQTLVCEGLMQGPEYIRNLIVGDS